MILSVLLQAPDSGNAATTHPCTSHESPAAPCATRPFPRLPPSLGLCSQRFPVFVGGDPRLLGQKALHVSDISASPTTVRCPITVTLSPFHMSPQGLVLPQYRATVAWFLLPSSLLSYSPQSSLPGPLPGSSEGLQIPLWASLLEPSKARGLSGCRRNQYPGSRPHMVNPSALPAPRCPVCGGPCPPPLSS